jgi:hypothetical protein
MKNFVKIDPSVSRFLDAAGLWDGLMGLPEPTRTTMLGAVSIALNADREAVRAEALRPFEELLKRLELEVLEAQGEGDRASPGSERKAGYIAEADALRRAKHLLRGTIAKAKLPAPPKEGT